MEKTGMDRRQVLSGVGIAAGAVVAGTVALSSPALADDDLVNALAQYLDLEAIERQALLEQPAVPERAGALIELLEMKTLLTRTPANRPLAN